MAEPLVVVEAGRDWKAGFPELPRVTARAYLSDPAYARRRGLLVINLCRHQGYQSTGYYCSLLAEARGHRVIPSLRTGLDLVLGIPWSPPDGLDAAARQFLAAQAQDRYALDVYFGTCAEPALARLAREVFDAFRAPILRVKLRRASEWQVQRVRGRGLQRLRGDERGRFAQALHEYLRRRWREPRSERSYRYDLAILHEPGEELPPSNRRALRRFVEAARRQGLDADLIERADLLRLAEYDALFLRVTTQVNHYSYRYARRAQREGLVVVDDPDSILRCTNKVFLAELLQRHRVPAPASVVLNRENLDEAERVCGYPMVLKVPDGSFSRGVFRAESREELETMARELFRRSELLLAQEYSYTEFDWRVGILGGRPLYVARYFMAPRHWQIVKHGPQGRSSAGDAQTLPVDEAPAEVVETALRAASLIGNGLYGVDLKQTAKGIRVIEINDNPSIDAGVEDAVLGERLYELVMAEFLARLERR